jgi:hypothetical protein
MLVPQCQIFKMSDIDEIRPSIFDIYDFKIYEDEVNVIKRTNFVVVYALIAKIRVDLTLHNTV